MSDRPALVAAAHGTRDAAGRAAIDQLRDSVAAARPDVEVVEAYVDEDVQQPGLSGVLARLDTAVVVPVLLSAGYHVHVDVTEAVAAAGPDVVATAPLGPAPELVDVLAERLIQAGVGDDAVVLAAAGSSDPRSAADVKEMAHALTGRIGRPVTAAFATAATPSITDAVAKLRDTGRTVAIAAYVLAPGHFHDRITAAGADVVTAPLLPHPAIADLVVRRYEQTVTAG